MSDDRENGRDGRRALRLKVLVSAYACEPGHGSEPAVGWHVARELSRLHDVTVVTRSCYRHSIEQAVAGDAEIGSLRFMYLDPHHILEQVLDRPSAGENFHYALWQWQLRSFARDLHRSEHFDVAQHVTFCRYWMAPGLAWVDDLPLVFGPVGGADSAPPAMRRTLSRRGRLFEAARDGIRAAFEQSPDLRPALRRCAVAIATTPATAASLKRLGARDVRILSEAYAEEAELSMVPPQGVVRGDDAGARAVCAGRLIEWKGYHLAIEAWAQAQVTGTLEVFGAGPSDSRLKSLARHLGVADRVIFHGRTPRERFLRGLQGARMLIHPSLHDSGGMVLFESMQYGVPVVCWDHAGPGQQIDDSCGSAISIDPTSAETSIATMAAAIRRLASDDQHWRSRSEGAIRKVREHMTWRHHAARLTTIFDELVPDE